MIDPDSMQDLELYLAAGRNAVHTEWVAATKRGDLDAAIALSDLWAHIHQAYALIKPINQEKD